MNTEKLRSTYWDNIKGILIFLTVFAHILYGLQNTSETINGVVDIIYMFHMPAFVFVSGYFGKSKRSGSFEGIIRLAFLYYVFNTVLGLCYGFSSLLKPLYSFWYLPAIIAWRLITQRIAQFREIRLILLALALFAGFFPEIDNTLALSRIICFYPYYMAGYLLSEEKSSSLISQKYTARLTKGLLFLALFAAAAFATVAVSDLTDEALLMSAYTAPTDCVVRLLLFVTAFLSVYVLRYLTPDRNIPLLTMLGRNSLWIFLLHRPFTLAIDDHLTDKSTAFIILAAIVTGLLLCAMTGNNVFAGVMNRFADGGAAIFLDKDNKKFTPAKLTALAVALMFILSFTAKNFIQPALSNDDAPSDTNTLSVNDIIHPVMTLQQEQQFNDAFRITFSGDLILLEDQVKRAYTEDGYDFSEVFEYAEKYISSADLAIGVFEGPMAGEEKGYTSSNFDDGKYLRLNFPDSFGKAVKDAGFDLVTTANNHLLDMGTEGAKRTLDVLDDIGLHHTGSYRDHEEKKNNRIKLIEYSGIRMAVLSYTFGSNYYNISQLTEGELSYVTSVISGTSGELFEALKKNVENDLAEAKALSPDLIIVLPHIGTQFANYPDEEQTVWFEIFKKNGADIILGDHSHAPQPAMTEEYDGRTVFTAYCPGNFANIYREQQGDTSMLVDVYINRQTKEIIGGAVIPLYTQSTIDGNYRALPIYDILTDSDLRNQLSTDDLKRAADANRIITDVVFGNGMDISSVTEKYYFDKNGFIRSKAKGLELTETMKNGKLYESLENASSVCFIGDSVTEGTKNGGCPWYEPIEEHISDKEIFNFSKGGCTTAYMNENINAIPKAELYIIAVGTNDVRYRDSSICAMDCDSYISSLHRLRSSLEEKYGDCKFIFIAPWYSVDGDPFCPLSYDQKTALNDEYSSALENYCTENSLIFINANDHIREKLTTSPDDRYLLDHIHPNSGNGVRMYSEAVLLN